jgi:signal peptidase I
MSDPDQLRANIPARRPVQTQLRPEEHPRHPHGHPGGVLPTLQSTFYVLIVGIFLMTFTVQPIRIPSVSMEPTLLVGDFLLLDKQAIAPDHTPLLPPAGIQRGDIIVFHDPVDDPRVHLVKRVIAIPGDRVHLRNGVVYLNGEPLEERYAVHRVGLADSFRDDFPVLRTMDARVNPDWWMELRGLVQDGDLVVPANRYFVLGDNRNQSEDSRYWGFVPRSSIVGKPVLIYFSWRTPDPDELDDRGPIRRIPEADGVAGRTDFARWDRLFRVVR